MKRGSFLPYIKEGKLKMFGLGDISIVIAMLGSIAVTVVCVIYGFFTWNKGDDTGSSGIVSPKQNTESDRKM